MPPAFPQVPAGRDADVSCRFLLQPCRPPELQQRLLCRRRPACQAFYCSLDAFDLGQRADAPPPSGDNRSPPPPHQGSCPSLFGRLAHTFPVAAASTLECSLDSRSPPICSVTV